MKKTLLEHTLSKRISAVIARAHVSHPQPPFEADKCPTKHNLFERGLCYTTSSNPYHMQKPSISNVYAKNSIKYHDFVTPWNNILFIQIFRLFV
jgi:hypothetical protein